MCSYAAILFKRELGMATCLTHNTAWCDKHQKMHTVTREYCRKHIDGFLAEGFDDAKIYTYIELCNKTITHLEYLNVKKRKEEDTPKYPAYSLAYFDNYSGDEEEEEENEEEEEEEEEPNVS